jgi:hypothetical protein
VRLEQLPIPSHFNPERVGEVWKVAYEEISNAAALWTGRHRIKPSIEDGFRVCLVAVDVQNTFCVPGLNSTSEAGREQEPLMTTDDSASLSTVI